MDLDAFTKAIGLVNAALTGLKQVKDLLPNKSKKGDIEAALEKAENEFKKAEAEAASSLGYEICKAHWPPVIMLSNDSGLHWVCPACGKTLSNDYGDLIPPTYGREYPRPR